MIVAREKSRLVPLKAMPTGKPTPLANAGIETSPVIIVDVIRSVSTMLVIVWNGFIFLASYSRTSLSSRKAPQFHLIFLSDVFVVLVVPKA